MRIFWLGSRYLDDVVLGRARPRHLHFFVRSVRFPVWHHSQAETAPDLHTPSFNAQAARGHPYCRKVLGRFQTGLPWVTKPFLKQSLWFTDLVRQRKLGIPVSANEGGVSH